MKEQEDIQIQAVAWGILIALMVVALYSSYIILDYGVGYLHEKALLDFCTFNPEYCPNVPLDMCTYEHWCTHKPIYWNLWSFFSGTK